MDVTFIVAVSLFLIFISIVLVSAINYFTQVPESAKIIEIRDKVKSLFDIFFGSGGIATSERLTTNLYRVPLLLQEQNGTARTNEVVGVTTDFDSDCTQLVSWNNSVRVYDQQFNELPSRISYQEFCSSQLLNRSLVSFVVNISANEKKRVYVYSINNTNTTAANWNLTIKGYWKFDDGSGTLATDSSGWQNNGTLKSGSVTCAGGGCPQWVSGIYGNALQFNGINNSVQISDGDSTNVTATFTLAAWVKRSQTGSDHFVLDHRDSSQRGYGMNVTNTDKLLCFVNAAGSGLQVASSSTISSGGWTHVACNFNSGNMSVYINGSYDTSATLNSNANKGSGNTTIGSVYSGGQYMNGTIDEVRIYNESLSASQISTLALASNQPLTVSTFPPENITAIAASKVQQLTSRNYQEVKSILGGGYDFRIEIK